MDVGLRASDTCVMAQRLASQGIADLPRSGVGTSVGHPGNGSVAEGSSRGQLGHLRPLTRESDLRLWSSMDVLADVTGRSLVQKHESILLRVSKQQSPICVGPIQFGFYVARCTPTAGGTCLRIRCAVQGSESLHRKGYLTLASAKQPQNWTQDEWQAAMQNPLWIDSHSAGCACRSRRRRIAACCCRLPSMTSSSSTINNQPVTELEIGLGERNQKEWTRVRRDGATITIKEDPPGKVPPSIVRFSKSGR